MPKTFGEREGVVDANLLEELEKECRKELYRLS